MIANIDPEPDQRKSVLFVGQDIAGHWLVQESAGRLEGRFISREAALSFARAERHGFGNAEVVFAAQPLVPGISFDPVSPDARVFAHAA
jgi:hypothetical protein